MSQNSFNGTSAAKAVDAKEMENPDYLRYLQQQKSAAGVSGVDAILCVDGQEILNYGRQSMPTFEPGHRLNSGPFGTMGVDWEERVRFDNHYIEHWSLGLDVKIILRTVGSMISVIVRSIISGVRTGAGEYAPMPPVFGPVSPSPTRL